MKSVAYLAIFHENHRNEDLITSSKFTPLIFLLTRDITSYPSSLHAKLTKKDDQESNVALLYCCRVAVSH